MAEDKPVQARLDAANATIGRLRAEIAHLGASTQELADKLEARPAGPPPYVTLRFQEYRTLLGLETVVRQFLETADKTPDGEGWNALAVRSWADEFRAALEGWESDG